MRRRPFPLAFLFRPRGQLPPMFAPSGDTGASQSCVGSLDGVRSTEFAAESDVDASITEFRPKQPNQLSRTFKALCGLGRVLQAAVSLRRSLPGSQQT